MARELQPNTLRNLRPLTPYHIVRETHPKTTLKRIVLDLDAASNGAAIGIITTTALGLNSSPEVTIAAGISTAWLFIHWLILKHNVLKNIPGTPQPSHSTLP